MVVAHPSPAPPDRQRLIEREAPLAALRSYLDEAVTRRGQFVVIRGEAGIGKTALLRSFLATTGADVTVLVGACDGVSTPQPFGPLEDMVPILGDGLRRLLEGNARRIEIGRWLLERLSDGTPYVLAIEDLQWADEATLEVLAFLARRLETLPLLVVVTHREDADSPPSVTRILGSLATLSVVRQLPIEPLTRSGVASLAEDRAAGIDVDDLYRISAGNPFYVTEVLTGQAGRTDTIPPSILDAVRARVGQLNGRGRRALEAAAIIGVRAEPWLLAAISGEDLIGIDDCLRVGLLKKADGIAFRHELTRMAVLEDLPVIRGIALHRKALTALERAGSSGSAPDAARLAYHAEGAADAAAVLRYASEAGHRALAVGSLLEAMNQFRRALDHASKLDDAARADLLEPYANVLFLRNHLPEACSVGAEAVALRRKTGNVRLAARDLSALALAAWVDGQGEEAWRAAHEAVELLEPLGDSRDLAFAWSTVGRLGLSSGQNDVATEASERALEIGRRVADAESTGTALATIGTVKLIAGEDTGVAALEESLRIGREASLPFIVDRALNNLGAMAAIGRRLDAAEHWFIEMQEHSERSEIERCSIDAALGDIALWRGDMATADRRARAALVAPRTDIVDRNAAILLLARVAVRRGEDDWERWLEEPRETLVRLPTTQISFVLASVLGEHAWLAGIPADEVPELGAAYAEARDAGDTWATGDLGAWLWRLGAIADVDELAAAPYLAEVAGRIAEAAAAWEERGMPYEAALARAGSADPSVVKRAHEVLLGIGATAAARKVEDRLREMGTAVPRGPRPSTRANPQGLTEREAEIAALLAEGLSNAEIADRLVLSPRTVGHHVSAVLGKLAVPRRGAVSAAIGRDEVSTTR